MPNNLFEVDPFWLALIVCSIFELFGSGSQCKGTEEYTPYLPQGAIQRPGSLQPLHRAGSLTEDSRFVP